MLVDVTVRGGGGSGGNGGRPPGPFSLDAGGPVYRLGRSLGHHRLGFVVVLVAWAPLLLIAVITSAVTGRLDPRFMDWSVQGRLLVALPLLILADPLLGALTRRAMEVVVDDELAPGRTSQVRDLLAAATRRLESALPEVVMVVLALVGSQIVGGGLAESIGLSRGRAQTGRSLFTIWYRLVSLPLYQFIAYRALWRWILWWRLLWRLSRLPLQPIASHPDRQGGLGFLAAPSRGFAVVLLALNSVQAAAWSERLDETGGNLASLTPQIAASLVLSLVLTLGPLVSFVWPLWRERYFGGLDFDRLAHDYTRAFRARWIEQRRREGLLGTSDLQSLADLGNSYGVVRDMRVVPLELRTVVLAAAATLAPLVPLLLRNMSAKELLQKLIGIAADKFF